MQQFEYPEDREFFAHLLADGDVERLDSEFSVLFDFRHPAIKRWEFDKVRKNVLVELARMYNGQCQLNIHPQCSQSGVIEPDHIIPLSSNILNKELRGMSGKFGSKAPSQSFGSNHPRNLTLACKTCNMHKKHRILDGGVLRRLLAV